MLEQARKRSNEAGNRVGTLRNELETAFQALLDEVEGKRAPEPMEPKTRG